MSDRALVKMGSLRRVAAAMAIAACGLLAGTPILAQETPLAEQLPARDLEELDMVVVVGGYATPQMWKVSKGDHVLWLLVIGKPAPPGVLWRSEPLETRLAESQLLLYASKGVGYSSSYSLSSRLANGRALEDAEHLPGKDTLKTLLSPEIYARWRALKIEYIGASDAIERRCPSCAMDELEQRVMKKMPSQPPAGTELQPLVEKIASKYKVKRRILPSVVRRVEFTDAERAMARMQVVLDMGDVNCFTQRLDYLERLIQYSRQQDAARENALRPRRDHCPPWVTPGEWLARWVPSGKLPDPASAQSMSDKVSLLLRLAYQQVDAEWMVAARAALAENKSTFAVQRIGDMPRINEYLAQFRELGYEVEEPGLLE